MHYGSHGTAECGAHGDGSLPDAVLTKDPDAVTCRTCIGWLPIVANWRTKMEGEPSIAQMIAFCQREGAANWGNANSHTAQMFDAIAEVLSAKAPHV